jgi:hypothetical protein
MNRHVARIAGLGTGGAVLVGLVMATASARSQVPTDVHTTQIKPNVYMLSIPAANAIVVIDDGGCLYAGVQTPALIDAAKGLAEGLHRHIRWAVMTEDDAAVQRRDGGWGESGALTIAQESLRHRMKVSKQSDAATALPAIGFSQVLQLYLKTEEVHLIHDQDGFSNSDLVVHVEKAGVLYATGLFTSDGYPAIRADLGGSASQMIAFTKYIIRNFHDAVQLVEPIVPGRGRAATMEDLVAYRDMLIAIHDRIGDLIARSYSLDQIQELEPTKPFDERWGHGPVPPADFTAQVYESIKRDQKNAAPAKEPHEHAGAAPVQPKR